jgi:hypothetical protein
MKSKTITVQTRQNRKRNWWCNGTINGYDYSFEGNTINDAKTQMIELLAKLNVREMDVVWEEPKCYAFEVEYAKPPIGYRKNRIDNLK